MAWKDFVKEFIYSISTNDKYSEYDSRKSFNRINKPEAEQLYPAGDHDLDHNSSEQLTDEQSNTSLQGTHEVKLAWRHIKNWLQKNTPELYSSLQSPCTDADLNDFQKDLNIKLPLLVIEFFKLTDGQSLYNENGSGGLLYGLKLLPLEEIMILTEHWRKVAKRLQQEELTIKKRQTANQLSRLELVHPSNGGESRREQKQKVAPPVESFLGSSYSSRNNSSQSLVGSPVTPPSSTTTFPPSNGISSSSTSSASASVPNQKSIPPGKIHPNYAHPLWIPIFTDEVGNCIGVDLCPPDASNYGQVILFGRDFDTKYLVADNFGDFMLIFANDLENGNWEIKQKYDETNFGNLMIGNDGELVFVDKQDTKLEINYMDVLKKRSLEKWIISLEKDSPEEVKHVVENLKNELKQVITFKNVKSIDEFISSNLSLIDKLNAPDSTVNTSFPVANKMQKRPSPLKVVTQKTVAKEPETDFKNTIPEVGEENEKDSKGLLDVPI